MSNEQLKEKVIGLYSKLSDIKEILKSVRKDLDINNIEENKDFSQMTTQKNKYVSARNPSPKETAIKDSNIIRQNNPSINIATQDNDIRPIRLTAINVPKQTSQKNQPVKNRTMVFFGHQNWNLVLNMMMGVQMAVKSVSSFGDIVNKLEVQDYKLKYYFELLPRRRYGDQSTFKICKFSDYAPQVFRMIRNKYNISSESYLKSIGPEALFGSLMRGDLTTLSELTSTGKSGSFFYYTADSRFTLKTIHKSEFSFLKKILPHYHKHLEENPNTLIIRVYGLHKIKYRMRNSIRYNNVFHTRKEIHERFDLKGSLYKRYSDNVDASVAKKEQNFLHQKLKIQVRPDQYHNFIEVVRKDCQFFEQNHIIDYSMLLGINYSRKEKRNSSRNSDTDLLYNFENLEEEESVSLMKNRNTDITYYFGIIDILTCFNTKKKLEYAAKRIAFGPDISTIPPQQYAARYLSFIENMFDESSKQQSMYQPNNNTSNNNIQISSNNIFNKQHNNNNTSNNVQNKHNN